MTYQQNLDQIFESFIKAKPFIAGKLDRDVRDPNLLLNIAREHGLIPPASKVIKITGSKGKGTVARLVAHSLKSNHRVGLIISPEEIDHRDRLRLNGQSISETEFIRCFEIVWGMTAAIRHSLTPPAYLSPYGLFLLIGLVWFKSQNVDVFVIETGRGVRFDEGGQIQAKVGVVTSIFNEHAAYLGPSLKEITADKLSISETCQHFIQGKIITNHNDNPAWYIQSQRTAKHCLEAFLDHSVDLPDADCASFGQKTDHAGRKWFYEGLIARESADIEYLKSIIKDHNDDVLFLISLPDDKDVKGVCAILDQIGGVSKHIVLTGERGFLSYEMARKKDVIYEGPYDAPEELRTRLNIPETSTVYFIGTQTYLRLVKQAFFT